MAACPECKKPISWWKVRSSFSCPSCGRELAAKVTGPTIAAIVIWIVADIPLKVVLYSALGNNGYLPFLVRTVLSGLLGVVLLATAIGQFSEVYVSHAEQRDPPT